MRLTVLSILLLKGLLSFSQINQPEAYLSFSFFPTDIIEKDGYYNFSVGGELFSYKFIAPEVEATFYFGSMEGVPFTSWVGGIGPKIIFDDDPNQFVLIPKYHFGSQVSNDAFYNEDDLLIEVEARTSFNFWSFAAGYEILSEEKVAKIGIYITYTGFNAGKTVNEVIETIEGTRPSYSTRAIGISVRLSTGFSKRKLNY